ncbi:ABC-2 type transport system ATP-binding protein [Lachnotalea glycerini]|uniref:ABC-2 type transport system ATP-binding protein n=1 Tax=Lachnotalea glycerini TaxID=1763509 RepID=A0A255IAG4_9FIRM|nr:ATP-binding cassette domain-containing protein [Lachnotalea glycerini]PXV88359.1 ABC-2 type transport system ATP-binding protein [Lachnotalea glycerini]RDY29103.1 ATP-binding cassette domain-containing protein [Lachnotalea glycerini]
MNEKNILINNATKKYGNVNVVKHVNLTFEKGKIHGIIGRNGSGKTVLLKAICGLITLTEGEINIFGKVIGTDIDIIENAGVIIESPGFLSNYNAFKNLKFLSMINKKIENDAIYDALNIVGLEPKCKKKVGKFSLGMKQRLGIAQAIMEDPAILILDEPMNGLDNHGVAEIRDLLLSLKKQGKTIIITSHNKEDIEILCDTVVEMDLGSIINTK